VRYPRRRDVLALLGAPLLLGVAVGITWAIGSSTDPANTATVYGGYLAVAALLITLLEVLGRWWRGRRSAAGTPSGPGVWVDARDAHGLQVGDHNEQNNPVLHGGNYYAGHHYAAAPASSSVVWPVRVGRAPGRADAYVDRPALRDRLGTEPGRTVVLTGAAAGTVTQVVTGDGGIGKTQLAAAAFHRATADGPGGQRVDVAVWVTATSRASILASYAQARQRIEPGAAAETDVETAAGAWLSWLAGTDRPWLVVLDDVADPGDLAGLWPHGPAGRVIVTTRRRESALFGHGRIRVDVEVFTPAESAAYLTAKLTRPGLPADVLDEAAELAADLGQLPVALAQAAAVIADDAIGCAAYRRLLADRTRTLAEVFPADPRAAGDDYGHTLAAVWALAADRADALPPRGVARRALALAAVLDPNGVPEQVFTTPAVCAHLGGNDRQPVAEAEARRAVRNLHRLSLLVHDPAAGARGVRMHALAQRATLEQLDDAALIAAIRAAADALDQAWPAVENDPALTQVLRADTTTLAGRHPTALWQGEAHPVLFRTGRSLGEVGLVTQAVDYFADLTECTTRLLGPDHPTTLATRHNLACWRGEAGDPAAAATALTQLLDDRLRVLGPDHPGTLVTRHNLAAFRGEAGDPAGAAAASEQLLDDQLRVLGPDHPGTLTTRANLAYWRGEAGDPAGAATASEQLLDDRLRVLGPDHPHTLGTHANLAYWRGTAGGGGLLAGVAFVGAGVAALRGGGLLAGVAFVGMGVAVVGAGVAVVWGTRLPARAWGWLTAVPAEPVESPPGAALDMVDDAATPVSLDLRTPPPGST
jgi:hypothetical protein